MADTIAAISTAPGEGAIGIVRVSGPGSIDIMRTLMSGAPDVIEPRHAYFGKVVSPLAAHGAEVIDEAVFIYMKGPASYTGEDMLEIQGHGSNVSLRLILSAVLGSGVSDVRMAEPGEFTKLAFLNGKMDLSQAEAVIDIIKAKTDLSLGIAEGQRAGRLSETILDIRQSLKDTLAQMAVDIDYPDEDYEIDTSSYNGLASELEGSLKEVRKLLDTASIGRIAREGIRVVIAGRPNAGKSSLMNAILGEGRVIVTAIPGTTRDTVEESATLGGLPVVLIDTAGLRDSQDPVERIGIERTSQELASADIVILVIDGSVALEEEDDRVIGQIEHIDPANILVVINKEDLGQTVSEEEIRSRLPGARMLSTSLIGKSAVDAAGEISSIIGSMLQLNSIDIRESNIITNERHLHNLRKAESDIQDAIQILTGGQAVELAELSAHYAYDALGAIIGEAAGDEILDTVFSKFCLGK